MMADWLFHSFLENDGKGIPLEYRSFPLCQEKTSSPRMNRVEWVLLGIQDKNLAHNEPLLS
jgi:hypothetical protein